MKKIKINLTAAFSALIFGLIVFLSACGNEDSIVNSYNNGNNFSEMPPASITVEAYWQNGFLMFKVKNNSRDTIINDFHVQFDPGVKITGYGLVAGWQIDPNSTDTANGKIGIKCGPQGQPIPPMGGVGIPLGVQLKLNGRVKKAPRQWWDFTWQATRDGIVVRSGMDVFPPR